MVFLTLACLLKNYCLQFLFLLIHFSFTKLIIPLLNPITALNFADFALLFLLVALMLWSLFIFIKFKKRFPLQNSLKRLLLYSILFFLWSLFKISHPILFLFCYFHLHNYFIKFFYPFFNLF